MKTLKNYQKKQEKDLKKVQSVTLTTWVIDKLRDKKINVSQLVDDLLKEYLQGGKNENIK